MFAATLDSVALVVRALYHGRPVVIHWDDGQVAGDEELVRRLQAFDGSGEPVGIEPNGRIREASLKTVTDALDLIYYLVDSITSISGDLPRHVEAADYLDE